MRAFTAVLRWLSPPVFALLFVLVIGLPAHADTGTYKILDYVVTLEPQSSGQVTITCDQTWQVLSGNIPWVTVGLPNSHFTVEQSGGDASKVYADNSGGFTGVRADLDRTYLPGETFTVRFVVLQSNLLERLTGVRKWRINYTPGWYDRATIDHLEVQLISPVALNTYSAVSPAPAATANNTLTWERASVPPGGKLAITVESLDGNFLTATAGTPQSGGIPWPFLIGIIIFALLVVAIVFAVKRNRRQRLRERIAATERAMAEDKDRREEVEKGFEEYVAEKDIKPDVQGRYYDPSYGNYITPAIWAAVIWSHQHDFTSPGAIGGSGGGGGGNFSCACACVACACACACACAGGGAAGCSRKTLHECRECEGKRSEPAEGVGSD